MIDITSDSCGCTKSSSFTVFEGANAPLNEELSVHFRGPLSLHGFAFYTAENGVWLRESFYNASSQTADNITFMANKGEDSPCMGKALTYADEAGTASASSSLTLELDNYLASDEELIIFSSESCPASGSDNSCGVYRSGIPAYHGFAGDVKMFLFEFEMPTDSNSSKDSVSYFDMPAIWLLNAKIPRTSEYPTNGSCSCWNSGCGELDLFEIMNGTDSDDSMLLSTIHDYQGTGNISLGLLLESYFKRDTTGVMKGGAVFNDDHSIVVFLLSDIDFSESLQNSTVASWYADSSAEVATALSSASMDTASASATGSSTSTSTKKSSGNSVATSYSGVWAFLGAALMIFSF